LEGKAAEVGQNLPASPDDTQEGGKRGISFNKTGVSAELLPYFKHTGKGGKKKKKKGSRDAGKVTEIRLFE